MLTINNTQSKKGTSRKPGPSGAGPQSPSTPAGGAEPPRRPRSPTCLSPLALTAGRLPQLTTSSPEAAASRGQVSDQSTLRANSTTQACPSKAPSALALSSFSPTKRFSAQGPRKMHVFMKKGMASHPSRSLLNLVASRFAWEGCKKKGLTPQRHIQDLKL